MQVDRATEFAAGVVAGLNATPVGKLEFLSCKRHMDDLKRQGTSDFPYVWNVYKANEIQDFAESLTLAEGDDPAPMQLYGFQCFMFGSWNGWVHKDTGYRRFRTSYVQVARQNGKSVGNAVPSMYYGNFDGYNYPQIYCTATKELQARIVLNECIKFINADKELSGDEYNDGLFTVKDYASKIECNVTHGVIRALGRDTKSIDGFRPYFGSVDEYHLHKDNQMYKLLTGGTKKLKQCLISVITTAGFELNCPCYELYEHCVKVLHGLAEDETKFIYITQLDKDDDIWDEKNWPKANPLWTTQTLESLRADAVTAKSMGGEELRDFMTKALNIWVQAKDNQYMDMAKWKECESDTCLEDMRGRECFLGLDLSSGGDLTSGCLEFPLDINGARKYFISTHSFMPYNRLAEHIKTDRAPYDMWARDELITLTETLGGVKTDYKYIIQYYKDIIAKYELKLKMIAYDPHNADAFLADLETFGCDTVMIVQSAKNLNDATVDFKLEVDAGNVIYNKKDKVLSWCIAYAITTTNSFGEIKIDKETKTGKRIDPCDAVIDAHKVTILNRPKYNPSVYATDEFLSKLWG